MKALLLLLALVIIGVTAVAVGVKSAQYESETAVAQAQSDGIIAQAQSQSEVAIAQASVDLAALTTQLELARMELESTRLANQVEMTLVNALLDQSKAALEQARAELQRLWMMLILPGLAAIVIVGSPRRAVRSSRRIPRWLV